MLGVLETNLSNRFSLFLFLNENLLQQILNFKYILKAYSKLIFYTFKYFHFISCYCQKGLLEKTLILTHSLTRSLTHSLTRYCQKGLLEKTLIIYTSDHGCHFRTRNSEYKRSCHDSSLRVPLVIRGPGFSGGLTVRFSIGCVSACNPVLSQY